MQVRAIVIASALALASLSAHAGLSDVTPLGKGRYMIGGRANTVFGSPGKLQAKAMKIANTYCVEKKPGTEAVMESATGQRAEQGVAGMGQGWAVGGGGHFAEAEVVFTCESTDATSTAAAQ